jgi:hypothetical protein
LFAHHLPLLEAVDIVVDVAVADVAQVLVVDAVFEHLDK